ncbi:MAG TPA: BON domain-containing protein [Pyrinomonadaceae bacterium]
MGFCNGMPSEEQIKADVLRELRQESRLKGTAIGVEVRDGTVTLTGTVSSTSEILAALEAANRADTYFYLVNQIDLDAGVRPTDQEIAKSVMGALERDAVINEHSLQVAISNGWVALSGKVERLREREEAERIARRTAGVRGVYNLIEVSPHTPSIENARDAIVAALRRYAEQEAEGIDVDLRNGTADVSGKVHTWTEKQTVLGALTHAPGVERVKDHLRVDPYF